MSRGSQGKKRGEIRGPDRSGGNKLDIHVGDITSLGGVIHEASIVYREMRLGRTDHQEGRGLIWALSQIRAMIEAKLFAEAHGFNPEIGKAEVPVAIRRFFQPPTKQGPRPPRPDSVKVEGTETKQ
jgi:hypothetical protein